MARLHADPIAPKSCGGYGGFLPKVHHRAGLIPVAGVASVCPMRGERQGGIERAAGVRGLTAAARRIHGGNGVSGLRGGGLGGAAGRDAREGT